MIKTSASISVQYNNIFAPFEGSKWEEGFEWVKSCGFHAAELIVSDPGLIDVDAIIKKLQSLGLRASTIATGQAVSMEGLGMTLFSEEKREATRKRLKADIDFSVELGRPNVTIGLIRGRGNAATKSEEYELLKRELTWIAEYASKRGVTLNLEPINRYECILLNSTESAYNLIEEIGMPENVGILYDAFHSNIEDANMAETIKKYGHKFSNVHFADSNRRLPGEGHIDFPMIVRLLEELKYNHYIALEVLNIPSAEHIVAHAAERIRNIFAEV